MDAKHYTTLRVTKKTRDGVNRICALEQESADGVIAMLLKKYYGELTDEKILKRIKEPTAGYTV